LAEARLFPAIELSGIAIDDEERLGRYLAELDGFGPNATDGDSGRVRIYFLTHEDRDRAAAHLSSLEPDLGIRPVLVSDESWAERSQAALQPVRIGGIVVAPPWAVEAPGPDATDGSPLLIAIQPSMGFGTGHHASTRLCLNLLQQQAIENRCVLDVGTGSGVLAIAAARLGARRVLAIDSDPDAIVSARENVERNAVSHLVSVQTVDIGARVPDGSFDVLLGNLTGGMLIRMAEALVGWMASGGTIIASGFELHEREEVFAAFDAAGAAPNAEASEDGWVGAVFRT
jgi:ribosomal protein L11 methyltransferase